VTDRVPPAADVLARWGASPAGVWFIAHVISPVQRWLLGMTRGRASLMGRRQVLLLTAVGRRTGRARSVPLFYVVEGDTLVVCNVRPPGEAANPWPMNVRAHPGVEVRVSGTVERRVARQATEAELARVWPRLVSVWPAYQKFFAQSGERSVFMLERLDGA